MGNSRAVRYIYPQIQCVLDDVSLKILLSFVLSSFLCYVCMYVCMVWDSVLLENSPLNALVDLKS